MIVGKSSPPRIYLDQNAWIKLARIHFGIDKSETLEGLVRAILAAVDANQIRVPLSFNHLIEACTSGDMERRKRLAGFMVF
jgi:hypothetical protein